MNGCGLRVTGLFQVSSFRFASPVRYRSGQVAGFLEWDNEMLDLHSVMVGYFGILHSLLYVVCFFSHGLGGLNGFIRITFSLLKTCYYEF